MVGRVISDGSENLIVKPTMELIDDEATGKYFPYHILGRFDNVYDIDSPFQILERDGKISIFYSNFFIGRPFENGNMDLDKFLIPYISRDENKEIYWFEDIGEMKYTNDNEHFECEVKIDGEWKILKH